MHNNPATCTAPVIRKYYPCNIHQCVFVFFACLLLLQWNFLLLLFSLAAFAAHADLFSVQRDWRVSMYGLWVGSVTPPELIHAFSLDFSLNKTDRHFSKTAGRLRSTHNSRPFLTQCHGSGNVNCSMKFFPAMNRERVQLELSFRFRLVSSDDKEHIGDNL